MGRLRGWMNFITWRQAQGEYLDKRLQFFFVSRCSQFTLISRNSSIECSFFSDDLLESSRIVDLVFSWCLWGTSKVIVFVFSPLWIAKESIPWTSKANRINLLAVFIVVVVIVFIVVVDVVVVVVVFVVVVVAVVEIASLVWKRILDIKFIAQYWDQ